MYNDRECKQQQQHQKHGLNTRFLTQSQIRKQSAQNWVWCPGVGCGHGQLHKVGSNNKITCKFCRFKNCYRHQGKWHEGFTCDEFDQLGDHDANTARSIAEIQRTTKPCPHCKARIKKEGGCNHMYCTGCKKQWLCKFFTPTNAEGV